ncbi:MAG: RNA pseudouridine synthase [Phycisphaerae bacterium]|nr:RNA pseudouridine synthase [Phycisphaerae bacterium]
MAGNKIEILYQDSGIIAVNKPVGLEVTNDRGGGENLIALLQKQTAEDGLMIIHRLDKDASGVILLAKNKDAQTRFQDLFAESKIKKTYLALTAGKPENQTGQINVPFMQCKRDSRKVEIAEKKGKDAETHWELLADFGSISLIAAVPTTDRTHQIRVHFQYAGFPLAIDPLYGANSPIMLSGFKPDYRLSKDAEEIPLIERLTLCAYELEAENLHFIAPLEKKFKATIKMLTKYNPKGPAAFLNDRNFQKLLNSEPLELHI